MIKLGKTTQVMKDSGTYPEVQITYLEKVTNGVVGNVYGLHTSPKTNSLCLVIKINNDEANTIIIPLSIDKRVNELSENEVEVGNFEIGSIINFDKDGNIKVTSKKDLTCEVTGSVTINASDVTINCNSEINGNLTVNGNIDATGTITAPTVVAGAVTASGAIAGGSVAGGGVDVETHVHSAGSYVAGATPVTGDSGVPS
jgi:phage gp45-like